MKKLAIISLLTALIAVVFFIQCEKVEEISPVVKSESINHLLKGPWYLKTIEQQRQSVQADIVVRLDFSKSETAINFEGYGQCIVKSTLLPKDYLTIDSDFICQSEKGQSEDLKTWGDVAYLLHKHLHGEISYSFNKGELRLISSSATLVFQKDLIYHTPEPYKFEGSSWAVEKIWSTDRYHSFKAAPELSFDADRMQLKMSGVTCQKTYSNSIGNYLQLSGTNFKCEANCCELEMQQVLMNALSGRQSYRLEEGNMVLSNNEGIKIYLQALE